MMVYDDDMPAFQLGYLDGAYDQAHWMGEEKSFDWGGEAWGLYEDYNAGYWDGWNNTQPLPEEYINDSRNWHEWLRDNDALPEYDIPDDAATINRLFTEYEATIAELRRQLREQQTLPPRYTHRNGEATMPDVPGWYWILYEGGFISVEEAVVHEDAEGNKAMEWADYYEVTLTPECKIYGPIPQPITKETNP